MQLAVSLSSAYRKQTVYFCPDNAAILSFILALAVDSPLAIRKTGTICNKTGTAHWIDVALLEDRRVAQNSSA